MAKTPYARLREELEHLQAEIRRLQARLEFTPDYGLGEGDPSIYDWELNWALLRRLQAREASIKNVLERMDEETYGFCERCGAEIQPERLAILPETTLCASCARGKK